MKNTAGQLVNLARKYEHVLSTGDASELLTLSPKNRQHAMRVLSNLAKYYGSTPDGGKSKIGTN
jgi:hypothetical protein